MCLLKRLPGGLGQFNNDPLPYVRRVGLVSAAIRASTQRAVGPNRSSQLPCASFLHPPVDRQAATQGVSMKFASSPEIRTKVLAAWLRASLLRKPTTLPVVHFGRVKCGTKAAQDQIPRRRPTANIFPQEWEAVAGGHLL